MGFIAQVEELHNLPYNWCWFMGMRQGTPVVHPTPTSTATEVRHCNPSYPSADRFHLCAHVPTLADQAMALDDALI